MVFQEPRKSIWSRRRFFSAGLRAFAGLGLARLVSGANNTGKVPKIRVLSRKFITGPADRPFHLPTDAATGPDSNVYILDGVNHRVLIYTADGRLQSEFGAKGSEPGRLNMPLGIAAGSERTIYVADSGNHRFQIFDGDGTLIQAVPLPASPEHPADPSDLAVDVTSNRLYIADNDNHKIHVYDLAEKTFAVAIGTHGKFELQFRYPFLIDTSAQGYLLVVEPINTRVQVINSRGKFIRFIGSWGVRPGQLFRPKGVAVMKDSVFVSDSYLGRVQVFGLDGGFRGILADSEGTPLGFTTPTGIAADPKHRRLYVVELKANRVSVLGLE